MSDPSASAGSAIGAPAGAVVAMAARGGPTALLAAAAAIALAGCGAGAGGHDAKAVDKPQMADKPQIALASPVVGGGANVPVRYACAPGRVWLPLRWGALPRGTAEVALYTAGFGASKALSKGLAFSPLVSVSLVVGLRASLHGVKIGDLPAGARTVGEAGVPACPTRGRGHKLIFRVLALSLAQRARLASLDSEPAFRLQAQLGAKALATGQLDVGYGP